MRRCTEEGCRRGFQNLREVQRHMRSAHSKRVIPCHACGGELFTLESLKEHHRKIHRGTTKCPFCAQVFRDLSKVSKHLKNDHAFQKGLYNLPSGSPTYKTKEDINVILERYIEPINGMLLLDDGPFVTLYDEAGMHPVFVFEALDEENLRELNGERFQLFVDDDKLPFRQVTAEAINQAKYNRGHLAPARNYEFSLENWKLTFRMRNIVPMDKFINNGLMKMAEHHVRELIQNGWRTEVMTLPVYMIETHFGKPVIGGYMLPIPTEFFKVIWLSRGDDQAMQIFRIPNQKPKKDYPLFFYKSTVDELQKLTAIRLKKDALRRFTWED